MYEVSNSYKDSIYEQSRTVKGRVTFNISDVTALGDIQSTNVSAEFIMSDKSQLTDLNRDLINYITCETDRVKLDGSFSFTDLINIKETGFASESLSDINKLYSTNPTMSFIFGDPHSSIGITVTFDKTTNEYAEEFRITAYDGVGAIIIQEDFVGNTLSQVVVEGLFYNYERLDIEIVKWSKVDRRARVAEIDFGVVRVYDNANLVKMEFIEEVDYLGKVIPTSEITFVVQNIDREFNLLNPEGIYKFLQDKQQVLPEIGVIVNGLVEYVPLGEFFLSDWNSDEGGTTASFTARDRLDIMSTFNYESLVAKTSYTLYDMAVDLFNVCGITSYIIDNSLSSIFTNGLTESTDCRTVLQMVSIAGMCHTYTNRKGEIVMKKLTITTINDTLSRDVIFNESKITLDKLYRQINIEYYTNITTKGIYSLNTVNTTGETLSYTKNTLINNLTQATNVANWVLGLIDYRAKFTTNYRGNPAYELLDVLQLEDVYQQVTDTLITKLELTYQGYLRSKVETRGVLS